MADTEIQADEVVRHLPTGRLGARIRFGRSLQFRITADDGEETVEEWELTDMERIYRLDPIVVAERKRARDAVAARLGRAQSAAKAQLATLTVAHVMALFDTSRYLSISSVATALERALTEKIEYTAMPKSNGWAQRLLDAAIAQGLVDREKGSVLRRRGVTKTRVRDNEWAYFPAGEPDRTLTNLNDAEVARQDRIARTAAVLDKLDLKGEIARDGHSATIALEALEELEERGSR